MSSRAIRIAIDRRAARSAPEVAYTFRTLLTTAGYAWSIDWAGASGEPPDISYGSPTPGASVQIPWCGREYAMAPDLEPGESTTEHGVTVVRFFGDAAGWARPAPDVLAFSMDVIFAAYWWLTGAREPTYRRDRRDNLYLDTAIVRRDGLLARPMVSLLAAALRAHFESRGIVPRRPPWNDGSSRAAFSFTHDVDYPEIIRWIEVPRALLRGELTTARDVLAGRSHFWQFAEWTAFERDLGARPTFFFMARRGSLAQYAASTPDAFYDIGSPRFTRLFAELRDAGCEVGLHASYNAYRDVEQMARERERVERTAGASGIGNRHHYWHLDPANPNETLRRHEAAGLAYDSSLGLECYPGFRRGICHPFRPWHPATRRALDVVQVPPAWMDDHFDRRRAVNGIDDPDACARGLLDVVGATGGVAVVDYHVRGMNAHFFPRYGTWLRGFAHSHLDSSFAYYTPGQIASAYRHHERHLLSDSVERLGLDGTAR